MCAAKNRKSRNKGKKASSTPMASISEPGNTSGAPLSSAADDTSRPAKDEDPKDLTDQVHRSQQELLRQLCAENEKADDILRRAEAPQAEMHDFRNGLRTSETSETSETHDDASEPESCFCAVQWPDASRQQLVWLHLVDRELGHRFKPEEHGFFRYLSAPEDQSDDENKVFYRHENTTCDDCGGARCRVSGPWSRVEAFSLVSRKILGETIAGEM